VEEEEEAEEEEVKVGLQGCLASATRRCGRGVAIGDSGMPCGLDLGSSPANESRAGERATGQAVVLGGAGKRALSVESESTRNPNKTTTKSHCRGTY
jgi:hypothetical protein